MAYPALCSEEETDRSCLQRHRQRSRRGTSDLQKPVSVFVLGQGAYRLDQAPTGNYIEHLSFSPASLSHCRRQVLSHFLDLSVSSGTKYVYTWRTLDFRQLIVWNATTALICAVLEFSVFYWSHDIPAAHPHDVFTFHRRVGHFSISPSFTEDRCCWWLCYSDVLRAWWTVRSVPQRYSVLKTSRLDRLQFCSTWKTIFYQLL